MTERGYYAISRGFLENPMFKAEPFTEREAFQWLIQEASYDPRRYRIGSRCFDLERGQLVSAIEFMRKAWKWKTKSRVHRILKRWESCGAILQKSERDATIITLCNYNDYQPGRNAERNAGGTLTERSRNETEEINKYNNTAAATRARPELEQIERQLREATGLTDNPSPSLCNLAPILGLMDAGFSLDDEILPAIRARGPTKRVTSWAYFVPVIHEYRQSRDAARNFQTAEVIHVGNRFRSQEFGLAAAIRKAREYGRTGNSGDAPVSENAVADGG